MFFFTKGKIMKKTTICYIENDGRYLMLHRTKKEKDDNKNKWIGVGGKIEEGETPDECLLREVYEETGLSLKSFVFRGIVHFRSEYFANEEMYLYTSNDFSGEIKECSEGELEWILKEDVLKLNLWEGDKIFLQKLMDDNQFFELFLFYEKDNLISYKFDHRGDVKKVQTAKNK